MDKEKISRAVAAILGELSGGLSKESLARTPERVAQMYEEIFEGVGKQPADEIDVFFTSDYDEMIMVRDLPVYSMCEHHLIPFFGKAHVAYIPNEKGTITGLSKLARVVDVASRRPQVQERLTMQIADAICSKLAPTGAIVVIEAEHLCMAMRGIKKPGAVTVTSAVRGIIRENPATRMEALRLIRNH